MAAHAPKTPGPMPYAAPLPNGDSSAAAVFPLSPLDTKPEEPCFPRQMLIPREPDPVKKSLTQPTPGVRQLLMGSSKAPLKQLLTSPHAVRMISAPSVAVWNRHCSVKLELQGNEWAEGKQLT